MRTHLGQVIEIRLNSLGVSQAWIACPSRGMPDAGQYLRAYAPGGEEEALAAQVFAAEIGPEGFLAAPPLPPCWLPGTVLSLYGPLGSGFHLGASVRRLALAALDGSPARLMPLIPQALAQGADVTLFMELPAPSLPTSVEISPLSSLPDALGWADTMALDLSLKTLPELRRRLGLGRDQRLPFPAQVLIRTEMPCAGLAECGVCAVPGQRGWKLACQDGPVFDLEELEW